MTTTAPVLMPTYPGGPTVGPKVEIILGRSNGSTDKLVAGIQHWPAEGDHRQVTEILLEMVTEQGLTEVDSAKARTLASKLHRFAEQLVELADQLDTLGGAVTTITAPPSSWTFQAPAWAVTTKHGRSGADERFAWVSHEGAPAVLAVPDVDGMDDSGATLAAANLFEFSEESEPTVTYLRVVAGDVDCDLTPAEVDSLIADTEAWLTSVRAMRAVMLATAVSEHQAGARD